MNQNILETKKATVAEIAKGFAENESFTVVSYQGLTVAEMQELRRTLHKVDATLSVHKNTLVRLALANAGQPEMNEALNGANAFVFSKELGAGPKALFKFSRRHEHLVVKGGIAEGKVLDAAGMKTISQLPDKNGMLSMFLSCLNAPIQKFAATVKAVADKDAPAAEANA
jgi:large subunit ribosomal protein L10